ncbi:MAG: hypothetical protein SF339_26495 [Blastocatellia bacterium]|nr:hypothetical protein [Blastocatellia bacterium]
MKQARTQMRVHERGMALSRGIAAAVSLHCHTHHSRELLNFIPHYAAMIPVVSGLFRSEMDRYLTIHGKTIDFSRAWWTPPATARQVLEMETKQIEREFDLPALVSITDHDDIEAGMRLQLIETSTRQPISLEWTVPYGKGFFHLGVHNLPGERAHEITAELMKHTEGREDAKPLRDLFAMICESRETLIVLNHPLWDIEFIGAVEHDECLRAFLSEHQQWLHAFEINGFRSWKENKAVLRMGEDLGVPVVAGGDRHGLQPNTLLNLTRAKSFDEYAAEIREDAWSTVALMPEYGESLVARTIEVVADVLRTYPNHPLGQPRWTDRIFVDTGDGCGSCALSRHWKHGGPRWVRTALWAIRVLGSRRVQPALRMALANERVGYES